MSAGLKFVNFLLLLFPALAQAHVGSPDVFYDGNVGSWPAHIVIRMPTVVPGQAEIQVQVQSSEPVTVSCVPLFTSIAISNAPPPEPATPVRGQTNLFAGSLWLMTHGAYSIEVRVRGQSGEGMVQIPVNSVAISQLPLPRWLGGILIVLGMLLFCGAVAIVGAAAGESTMLPGDLPGAAARRKYRIAGAVAAIVLALGLFGGKMWWDEEEHAFRARLHDGGWPDLAANVRVEHSQRILRLTVGERDFGNRTPLALATDHGKLLHLFLVALPNHQAFAHAHPIRQGNNTFDLALPPLPEGDYQLFCDLTLESGLSSTATNTVHLPPIPAPSSKVESSASDPLEQDPDDSWVADSAVAVRDSPGSDVICRLADGTQVVWKRHPQLYSQRDAYLHFQVLDSGGRPAVLLPYMGMMSHAAVMRSDARVFAHLHPSGNFSMAAQMVFDAKVTRETGVTPSDAMASLSGVEGMTAANATTNLSNKDPICGPSGSSLISLPYQFPTPGDYRVWVQVRIVQGVVTAIFDTTVK